VGKQFIWYGMMTQDEKNIMFIYAHGTSSKAYNYNKANARIVTVSLPSDPYMHRYVSPLDYNVAIDYNSPKSKKRAKKSKKGAKKSKKGAKTNKTTKENK